MIKIFCDRCNIEIDEKDFDGMSNIAFRPVNEKICSKDVYLCNDCKKIYNDLVKKTKDTWDIEINRFMKEGNKK